MFRFELYDFQEYAINETMTIEITADGRRVYIENVMWEKSRQMGMSWTGMAIQLWGLLFDSGWASLNQNRKESKVDDGGEGSTTDSLMGKLRFMYDNLPEWIKDFAPVSFKFLEARNRRTGAFVHGESANVNSGRGGTYKMVFQDEDAFIPASEIVFAAVRHGCKRGIVKNSTPNGKGNCFYRIKQLENTTFKKLRFHWSQHPVFGHEQSTLEGKITSPWYEVQCSDMTVEDIAQELDISYDKSVQARVFPEFSQEQNVLRDPFQKAYDPERELHLDFDYGVSDPTSVGFMQMYDDTMVYIAEYESSGIVSVHVEAIKGILSSIGYTGRHEDLVCHGDPSGSNTDPITGTSVVAEYGEAGIIINHEQTGVKAGIDKVRVRLKQRKILVNESCLHTINCFENCRWKTDKAGGVVPGQTKYLHDWTSHAMDRIRYKVMILFPTEDNSEDAFLQFMREEVEAGAINPGRLQETMLEGLEE